MPSDSGYITISYRASWDHSSAWRLKLVDIRCEGFWGDYDEGLVSIEIKVCFRLLDL